MDHQDLLARVDATRSLDFLASMIQHKSYSETDGEKALARFMVEKMREIGVDADLQDVPGGRFNAIGRLAGSGGGQSLLFNGHLDTNPVTEGWTVDPWGGVYDDEFIYGIGCSNMKAGDAAYYCAVRTLLEAGVKLKGDVILTYVVGELQGGIGTIAAIEAGVRADCFINSEPTDLQALTMHAGAFTFIIELTGVTRHLSKREEGVDALMAACQLVPELDGMTFSGALSDRHLSVNRGHIGVLRAGLGKEFYEWRPPQVADFARLKGSARYAPGQSETSVMEDIQDRLDALEGRFLGLKAKLIHERDEGRPSMQPFEVSEDAEIVRTINSAYRAVRGTNQPTGVILPPGYYGTDAAHFYQRLGMEGIVCGPGGRYNTMPDERVDVPDYLDMIKIYMLCILATCGQQNR
jgi:acetylornithine deacetylase